MSIPNRSIIQYSVKLIKYLKSLENILNGKYYSNKEILNEVSKSLSAYLHFKTVGLNSSQGLNAIVSSLNVKSNWLEYENIFKSEKNYLETLKNPSLSNEAPKSDEIVNKIVHKIKYCDKSIYVGEVQHGQRYGLGSLLLCGQVRYRGYFKNDKFNGLGCLSNLEFKLRGVWNNGKPLNVDHIVMLN